MKLRPVKPCANSLVATLVVAWIETGAYVEFTFTGAVATLVVAWIETKAIAVFPDPR